MTIDSSGKWWKGTDFSDIEAYLKALKPGGYPVTRFVHANCACGGHTFGVYVDAHEGAAKMLCTSCAAEVFVADSGDHWSEASPVFTTCPCKGTTYDVGVGLYTKDERWNRWLSIGVRCVRCGVLASPADWKSDLEVQEPVFLPVPHDAKLRRGLSLDLKGAVLTSRDTRPTEEDMGVAYSIARDALRAMRLASFKQLEKQCPHLAFDHAHHLMTRSLRLYAAAQQLAERICAQTIPHDKASAVLSAQFPEFPQSVREDALTGALSDVR